MCFKVCMGGNTMALEPLEFRQANPVEFGEFVISRKLNIKEWTKPTITHWLWTGIVLLMRSRQTKTSRYCATSTRLILIVWDTSVSHKIVTCLPMINGIRLVLAMSHQVLHTASCRSSPFGATRVDKRDDQTGCHTPKHSHQVDQCLHMGPLLGSRTSRQEVHRWDCARQSSCFSAKVHTCEAYSSCTRMCMVTAVGECHKPQSCTKIICLYISIIYGCANCGRCVCV